MDKKRKKPSVIETVRASRSGKFTKVTREGEARSKQTIDRIAKRHERVLKRLADK